MHKLLALLSILPISFIAKADCLCSKDNLPLRSKVEIVTNNRDCPECEPKNFSIEESPGKINLKFKFLLDPRIDLNNKDIRSLRKLAYDRQMLEAPHRRTGAYPSVREDSRSGVTTQLPSEVEFPERSIDKYNGKHFMVTIKSKSGMIANLAGVVDKCEPSSVKEEKCCLKITEMDNGGAISIKTEDFPLFVDLYFEESGEFFASSLVLGELSDPLLIPNDGFLYKAYPFTGKADIVYLVFNPFNLLNELVLETNIAYNCSKIFSKEITLPANIN